MSSRAFRRCHYHLKQILARRFMKFLSFALLSLFRTSTRNHFGSSPNLQGLERSHQRQVVRPAFNSTFLLGRLYVLLSPSAGWMGDDVTRTLTLSPRLPAAYPPQGGFAGRARRSKGFLRLRPAIWVLVQPWIDHLTSAVSRAEVSGLHIRWGQACSVIGKGRSVTRALPPVHESQI